jgi:thiol-disulfide isomerase/thioredoxin
MRALLISLVLLSLAGCSQNSTLPSLVADERGSQGLSESVPVSFQIKRYPGGEPYDVASDRGSVLLLDIWATWCEPCKDALPLYQNLAQEYGSRGLKVYAINVDEDPRGIQAFLDEAKVSLPVLLDANAVVAEKKLYVKLMPTSFLVDRKGVVRFIHEGFAEEFLQKYQTEIEMLLAERAQ